MPLVVVTPAFRCPGQPREDGLHPVEGLDLRLLIHAPHYRPLRRVQVEVHHIANFVHDQRVRGQFERFRAVGLEPKRPPDPADGSFGEPDTAGHAPGNPVGRLRPRRFRGFGDNLRDPLIGDLPRGARSGGLGRPVRDKPLVPLAHHGAANAEFIGHGWIRQAVSAAEPNASLEGEGVAGGRAASPPFLGGPLVGGQGQGGKWPTISSRRR